MFSKSSLLESISLSRYGYMYSTRSVKDKSKPGMLKILETDGNRHSFRDSYVESTSLNTAFASIAIVTVLLLVFSTSIMLFHSSSSSSNDER